MCHIYNVKDTCINFLTLQCFKAMFWSIFRNFKNFYSLLSPKRVKHFQNIYEWIYFCEMSQTGDNPFLIQCYKMVYLKRLKLCGSCSVTLMLSKLLMSSSTILVVIHTLYLDGFFLWIFCPSWGLCWGMLVNLPLL